jgi:hypothetical protein
MYNNIDACMIKDAYYDKRDVMNTVLSLMGGSAFRRCNKHIKALSMKHSIDIDWFKDIVRIYETPTEPRERLTTGELKVYYNYATMNRIILPH